MDAGDAAAMGVALAGSAAIVLAGVRSRHGGSSSKLDALASELDGETVRGAIHGVREGRGFRVRLPPAGPYGNDGLATLSVVCRQAGRLRITLRNALDRLVEPLLPHEHLSHGDVRFRERYLVQTRDFVLGHDLLADAAVRAAVGELFALGARVVHVDGERVEARVLPSALGKPPERDRVWALLEPLATIGAAVSRRAGRHPLAPRRDPRVVACWWGVGTLGVLGVAAVLTGAARFEALDRERPILIGLGLGALAFGAGVVGLTRLLANRTSPGRTLVPLALLGLLGSLFLGAGVLIWLDGLGLLSVHH